MPTVTELGQKTKAKYPEYKDMSDLEVGQKIKAKYPKEYGDFTDETPTTTPTTETKEPTFGGKVVRGMIKPFVKVGASVKAIQEASQGKQATGLTSKYLGNVRPVGEGFDITQGLTENNVKAVKDSVGTGFDIASNIPIAKGVGIAANVAKQPFQQSIVGVAKGLGKEGLIQGGLSGGGQALQENKGLGGFLGDTALGSATGGLLGFGMGAVGAKASRILSKTPAEFTSKLIDKDIRKAYDGTTGDIGKIDQMAFGSKKGLELLSNEAPSIKIPDTKSPLGSSATKAFDLKNANGNEFLSAVNKLEEKVVKNAKEAVGEASKQGFVLDTIKAKDAITQAVNNGDIPAATATRLYKQIDNTKGDPEKLFDWVQGVNMKYKNRFEKGTIDDMATSKLANDIADVFRKELNSVTDRTGYAESMANIRELKRLMLAVAKKANKGVNFGDITSEAGLDAGISLLSGNPLYMTRALASSVFKGIVSKVRNTAGIRSIKSAASNIGKIPNKSRLPSLDLKKPKPKPEKITIKELREKTNFQDTNEEGDLVGYNEEFDYLINKGYGDMSINDIIKDDSIPNSDKSPLNYIKKNFIEELSKLSKEHEKDVFIPSLRNTGTYERKTKTDFAGASKILGLDKENISDSTIEWVEDWINLYDKNKTSTIPKTVIEELSKYKPKEKTTLYRGGLSDKGEITSWTYDKKVAQRFANKIKGGKVFEKEVFPNEIIVDFTKLPENLLDKKTRLQESEVLLKPKTNTTNPTKLPTIEMGQKPKSAIPSIEYGTSPKVLDGVEIKKKDLLKNEKVDKLLKDWVMRDPTEKGPSLSKKEIEELGEVFKEYNPKKPVTLYRGIEKGQKEGVLNRLSSWTYNKEVAMDHTYGEGKVIKKKVNPDEILVDLTNLPYKLQDKYKIIEDEMEVILKPLNKPPKLNRGMTSKEGVVLGGIASTMGVVGRMPGKPTTYTAKKEEPKKEIPPKVLGDALMALESSNGTDNSNQDGKEMRWLTGLTAGKNGAVTELKRLKLIDDSFDENNKEDVLDASIKYFKLMQERNPELSPAEVYVDAYWTQWETEEQRQKKIDEFNSLINN